MKSEQYPDPREPVVDVFTDPTVMSMPRDVYDLAAVSDILYESLGYIPFCEFYGPIVCYTHNGERLQIDSRGLGRLRRDVINAKLKKGS